MELVKKNLTSIICGVIALLAVVALFWPISGYYQELQAKADSRKQVFSTLQGILTKQRKMPVVDLNSTEAKDLGQFPTQAVIDWGNSVMQAVKSQSGTMFDALLKMNQHAPLVPSALPEGRPMDAGRFKRVYELQMLLELAKVLNPQGGGAPGSVIDQKRVEEAENASTIFTTMKAGFPPTAQQIQNAREAKANEIKAKTAFNIQGQPINGRQIDQELQLELPKVGDELTKKAAQSCKVYIDLAQNAMTLDPLQMIVQMPPNQTPDPSVMYAAQVGLWIQQDVAAGVASANANAKTVEDAPVKHLVAIRMPPDFMGPIITGSGQPMMPMGPEGQAPPPPNPDPAAKPPQNFAMSPTGRISNGVYDVIPFKVKMDVDAAQVPHVLQELSRNKLITVTNCSISAVDLGLMQANGYYYGDKPVVTLDLDCEALLLRKWTEPLMPLRVKTALGINPQPAPPPG